jgi:hypothetical protein
LSINLIRTGDPNPEIEQDSPSLNCTGTGITLRRNEGESEWFRTTAPGRIYNYVDCEEEWDDEYEDEDWSDEYDDEDDWDEDDWDEDEEETLMESSYPYIGEPIRLTPASNIKLIRKGEVPTMNGIKLVKEGKKGLKALLGEGIGKITTSDIRLSMSGIAIKNEQGTYVVYDKTAKTLTDVKDFVVDADDMFYGLPVKEPKVGDLIKVADEFLYVTAVTSEGVKVINPMTSQIEIKVPVKNLFGFNFFVKVVSMMDMMNQEGGQNSLLPLMLMKDGDTDLSEMMMLMMASGQKMDDFFGGAVEGINPMMLMMAKGGKGDMLETMLLMKAMNPSKAETPTTEE